MRTLLVILANEMKEPDFVRKSTAIRYAELIGGEAIEFSEGMYAVIGDAGSKRRMEELKKKFQASKN